MEKKEMSFIEKFEAAHEELEKELNHGIDIIMIAVDDESEEICAVINGNEYRLSALLATAAIRDKHFKKILTDSIKVLEVIEQKNK